MKPEEFVGKMVRVGPNDEFARVGIFRCKSIDTLGRLVVVEEPEDSWFNRVSPKYVTLVASARIRIRHVAVKGVPCVELLEFVGIAKREDLPESYVDGRPSFFLLNAYWNIRKFDGTQIVLGDTASGFGVDINLPDGVDVSLFGEYSAVLSVGDVIEEKAFREILVWLKRAGSRLAKIRRKEEKQKEEWVEI